MYLPSSIHRGTSQWLLDPLCLVSSFSQRANSKNSLQQRDLHHRLSWKSATTERLLHDLDYLPSPGADSVKDSHICIYASPCRLLFPAWDSMMGKFSRFKAHSCMHKEQQSWQCCSVCYRSHWLFVASYVMQWHLFPACHTLESAAQASCVQGMTIILSPKEKRNSSQAKSLHHELLWARGRESK